MDYKMEMFTLFLYVIPAFVTAITITSNGNSPEIKMKGGMMMENKIVPMVFEESTVKTTKIKPKNHNNTTKLSINERYRRLIPYMTFYYANDLATPNVGNMKDIEVEKAEIIHTEEVPYGSHREPKKIIYSNRNIPLYQGNRLTQHNIASANPTKIFYKSGVLVYQTPNRPPPNFQQKFPEYNTLFQNDFEPSRTIHKLINKSPNVVYITPTRKPYLNLYHDDTPNIRYYLSEKEQSPKYKLVPYEQTPPVKVPQNDNLYDVPNKSLPTIITKDQTYSKPRPGRPHYVYEEVSAQQPVFKPPPAIVSENYYEKQHPMTVPQPIVQNGFKPLYKSSQFANEETRYTTALPPKVLSNIGHQKHRVPSGPVITIDDLRPNYYEYVVEQTTAQPMRPITEHTIPLASLLNSLQLNKSIPKQITKENVSSSIRTLLQVLNALKAVPQYNDVEVPVLSTPKPFILPKIVKVAVKPEIDVQLVTEQPQSVVDADLHDEPYLAHVSPPSQHLDDFTSGGGTSQQFPLPVTSDDEGGTPGQPGVDYPILTVIPTTEFNCKSQRYKGFFADPETRCQVWHYCDLNGGQASFLCPNGTIFSQAGLTCDWWFNVRCNTTTQLYVLNESLYKYILPHSPKFPEDYSGPLVDKYLTLKFKEMEEQFKKNKNKQSASEKMDSNEDEQEESGEDSTEKESPDEETDDTNTEASSENTNNVPIVTVESPGTSGNVERLHE